jgi:hypothetical protein
MYLLLSKARRLASKYTGLYPANAATQLSSSVVYTREKTVNTFHLAISEDRNFLLKQHRSVKTPDSRLKIIT